MRNLPTILLGTTIALSLVHTRAASADEETPETAAPAATPAPAPPPPAQAAPAVGEDEELRHVAITGYPLSLIIGRYSVQGEYLPVMHHAITLNPFYTSVDGGTLNGASLGKFSGFGSELGYRFYTGKKGPNGFFVGPSFLFASYKQSGGLAGLFCTTPSCSTSFTSYGFALDVGGQAVLGGFVVGGGAGFQSTKNSKNIATDGLNFASAIIGGGGFRPRVLLTFGYAF
ncbi:MAG TPA: hypothetical protein VGI10_02205 [Polyangiaceae bacterium]|jgi:hypothetical protein